MDSFEIFIVAILTAIVAIIVTLAVIFIPVEVRKQNALTNLYNGAAEGNATGVIIQIGSQSK